MQRVADYGAPEPFSLGHASAHTQTQDILYSLQNLPSIALSKLVTSFVHMAEVG
uniref:Uncharacterized protein n=1 Tax=Nelumbo nucifera TaxID=4432 RepID=A0A822YDV6_NELNU|nr:TPA_asm: hypothetical protein HUJ06_031159 [Nelumbo nucifera]